MVYSIQRLQTLSDEDLKEIADLTAKAFGDDEEYSALLGGDLSLGTEYCNAVLRAGMLEGEVYILTIEREGKTVIASWAVFFPPSSELFGTEAQRALGFDEFLKKLKPEAHDWYTKTYPKYAAEFLDKVFTKEEQKRYWWCNALVTRPDLQKNGYGTALINIGYQRAKKTKELGTFLGAATVTKKVDLIVSKTRFKEIGQKDCPLLGGQSMSTNDSDEIDCEA